MTTFTINKLRIIDFVEQCNFLVSQTILIIPMFPILNFKIISIIILEFIPLLINCIAINQSQ